MFEYFPDHYAWTNLAMCAISAGGHLTEVDEICRPLKDIPDKTTPEAMRRSFESWRAMADKMCNLAERDEQLGNDLSASRKYHRATVYYMFAEMQITVKSDDKIPTYRAGQQTLHKAIALSGEPVEYVEVPFEDTTLPGLFVPAITNRDKAPCVVHFDGFDWNKELMYCLERQDMAKRGVSLLLIDTPGVGEARRMRDLPLRPDTETSAGACVDYLVSRDDVDSERLGVTGISMGGYYAPRAAAFEKRFKCVAAWGGLYDFAAVLEHVVEQGTESMPDQIFHAGWVIGEQDPEKMSAKFKELTLKGVLDKITVPLLVLHPEGDRQIELWHAERTYEEAVNSPSRYLRIVRPDELSTEHVHFDNMNFGSDYLFDWLSRVLLADDPVKEALYLKDRGM